jgi:hypothetical protein
MLEKGRSLFVRTYCEISRAGQKVPPWLGITVLRTNIQAGVLRVGQNLSLWSTCCGTNLFEGVVARKTQRFRPSHI